MGRERRCRYAIEYAYDFSCVHVPIKCRTIHNPGPWVYRDSLESALINIVGKADISGRQKYYEKLCSTHIKNRSWLSSSIDASSRSSCMESWPLHACSMTSWRSNSTYTFIAPCFNSPPWPGMFKLIKLAVSLTALCLNIK